MTSAWDNIPDELKSLPHWCVAAPDKSPYKPTGQRASVTNPSDWTDWSTASRIAAHWSGAGIGYVLHEGDQISCIDLDVKDDTPPETIARYQRIIESLDSYTERSRSGKGYHIWVKGKVGPGARRDGVEIYSQERFIICTGNVVLQRPIADRQHILDMLVADIRNQQRDVSTDLVELPEVETDDDILRKARSASNADKFADLWAGNWQAYPQEYPSQSEADLSLMSMLCFYTESNVQVRRLFRLSALGQREKATRNDKYINRTLSIIRGRQNNEKHAAAAGAVYAAALVTALAGDQKRPVGPANPETDPKTEPDSEHGAQAAAALLASSSAALTSHDPERNNMLLLELRRKAEEQFQERMLSESHNTMMALENAYTDKPFLWPPGATGELARWIYHNSVRPVQEIAITTALGIIAGFAGRAYNISGSGLNVYLVLLASSGVGKESITATVSKLLGILQNAGMMAAPDFISFDEHASGPALMRDISSRKMDSMLHLTGEWGRKLRRLADDKAGSAAESLRTSMTQIYQKSGNGSTIGGIRYSDAEKNAAMARPFAYTMMGEATPSTFFDALTPSMMEDGFLSRFIHIMYTGERPEFNERAGSHSLSAVAGGNLCQILNVACTTPQGRVVDVVQDEASTVAIRNFDKFCDRQINDSMRRHVESWRQSWNRAHLKVLKVAALLAVMDNPSAPVVTMEHTQWAMDLVNRDILLLQGKALSGELASVDDDEARMQVIRKRIVEYLTGKAENYKVDPDLKRQGLIPARYLQQRTQLSNFKTHKLGHSSCLKLMLATMVANGELRTAKGPYQNSSYFALGPEFQMP